MVGTFRDGDAETYRALMSPQTAASRNDAIAWAEYRLRNLRRMTAPVVQVRDALLDGVPVPDEPAQSSRFGSADYETQIVLVGTLVGYGFSILEAALYDVVSGLMPPGIDRPRPRRLERWLEILADLGIDLNWEAHRERFALWSSVREIYLYQLNRGSRSARILAGTVDINDFLALIEEAVGSLDRALATAGAGPAVDVADADGASPPETPDAKGPRQSP